MGCGAAFPVGRERQTHPDVSIVEVWKIRQNLRLGHAGSQIFQDVVDGDPKTAITPPLRGSRRGKGAARRLAGGGNRQQATDAMRTSCGLCPPTLALPLKGRGDWEQIERKQL